MPNIHMYRLFSSQYDGLSKLLRKLNIRRLSFKAQILILSTFKHEIIIYIGSSTCDVKNELYTTIAGLPGVARAFTTLKLYNVVCMPPQPPPPPPPTPHHPPPRAPRNFLTFPRPVPGRPRPTCKVSALYLENCANASRQTDRQTDRDRQTILFIDIDLQM